MNFLGIISGLCVFFIIGFLHPVVIKSEYYFGKEIWPIFFITGLFCIIMSCIIKNSLGSILFSVLGFSLLWSIKELFEQENRVEKGWFAHNERKIGYNKWVSIALSLIFLLIILIFIL